MPETYFTAGEGFPDGSVVDVLSEGRLIFWDGQHEMVTDHIDHFGRRLCAVPIRDGLSILLPAESTEFGSERELHCRIRDEFSRIGLPDDTCLLLSCFVLSTWFHDLTTWVPCLFLHGAWADCGPVAHLLSAFCRRSLVFSEFNKRSLTQIPLEYRPTVIVVQNSLTLQTERFLADTVWRGGCVQLGTQLVSFDCPRVVFCTGSHTDSLLDSRSLRLRVPSCRARSDPKQEIARKLQSQLLRYRLLNWKSVRDSNFSLDQLMSNMREIAVSLGRCIVEDVALQLDLVQLFEIRDEHVRTSRALTKEAAVVEALLAFCTEDRQSVFVGDVAEAAGALMRFRVCGNGNLEPRAVGEILRHFGLRTQRKGGGCSLELSPDARYKIHEVATELDVLSLRGGAHSCSNCTSAELKQ